MSDFEFLSKEIDRIASNLKNSKDYEGKKPIRVEAFLYLIQVLEELQSSLEQVEPSISSIRSVTQEELPAVLASSNKMNKAIESSLKTLESSLQTLGDLTKRTENIEKREKQLDETIQQASDLLKQLKVTEELNAATSRFQSQLDSQSTLLTEKLSALDEKLQKLHEKQVAIENNEKELAEKNKVIETQQQELNKLREDLDKRDQELQLKETAIQTKQEELEKSHEEKLHRISEHENLLRQSIDTFTSTLDGFGSTTKAIEKAHEDAQKSTQSIINLEKSLKEEREEATKIIAEKKYLQKLEPLLDQRAKEIAKLKEKLIEDQKSVSSLFQQFSLLSEHITYERNNIIGTISEFGNSLDELSGYIQVLDDFSSALNRHTNQMESDQIKLSQGVNEYKEFAGQLAQSISELDKQKNSIVKLNALTNTVQLSAKEFYDVQVGLQVLIESIQSFVDQNVESVDSIKSFMQQANSLFSMTRNELERYNYYRDKAEEARLELKQIEKRLDFFKTKEMEQNIDEAAATLPEMVYREKSTKSSDGKPRISRREPKDISYVQSKDSPPMIKKPTGSEDENNQSSMNSDVSREDSSENSKKEERENFMKEREILLKKLKEATGGIINKDEESSDEGPEPKDKDDKKKSKKSK